METQRQTPTTSIGLLILRLGVGGFMLTHGWGKLQMLLAGEFEKFADPIGLGKELSLAGIVGAEFVCALLVVLGLGTRPAAAVTAFAMGVAAFAVHGGDPWTMQRGAELFQSGEAKSWASKEPALLYLIPFLTLVFTGAGRLSLDHLIWSRRRERRAAAALQGGPQPR